MRLDINMLRRILGMGKGAALTLYTLYQNARLAYDIFMNLRAMCGAQLQALLEQARKALNPAIASAEATTNTKVDDYVVGCLVSLLDWLLKVFHAQDDYDRLLALDKAVTPAQ